MNEKKNHQTEFLHAGAHSGKLTIISMIFGLGWSKTGWSI